MRMPYQLSACPQQRPRLKTGRELISTEVPRSVWAKRGRAFLSAWGCLEEEAEDRNMRVVMGTRRVIDKGPMIRLECEITQEGPA